MNNTMERSSDFVHGLGDAIRKNPLSAALIGMGAVWLFSNRGGKAADTARDVWEGTASTLNSGAQALQEGAQATAASVRGRGSQAIDQLSDAGTNLGDLFRAQPLALGAVGLAVGAVVAASLPTSELERIHLGESSDFIKQKASEVAGEQTQRAVEIGKQVVDAVADEAQQQGLTTEALTNTASDLSEKIARVASAATVGQHTREPSPTK